MLDNEIYETEGKTREEVIVNINKFYDDAIDVMQARKKKTIFTASALLGAGLSVVAIAKLLGVDEGAMQTILGGGMAINGVVVATTISKLLDIFKNEKMFLDIRRRVNEGEIDPFEFMSEARASKKKLEEKGKSL